MAIGTWTAFAYMMSDAFGSTCVTLARKICIYTMDAVLLVYPLEIHEAVIFKSTP